MTAWTVLLELDVPDEKVEPAARALLEVAREWDPGACRKSILTAQLDLIRRPERAFQETRSVADSAGTRLRRGLKGRKIA